MNSKEEYIRKMQAQLEELNTEIDRLTTRAGEAKADVMDEYNEIITALKARLEGARVNIEELQQAGENAWDDLKNGIDTVWSSIQEAISSARSRFK